MPGTMCAVARCKNSLKITKSLSKDISYHTFPKNTEPQRLKTWILRTKRADKFNPMSSHICSEHFNAEDFERNLQAEMLNLKVKRQLKKSAVPSLKLLENDKSPPIGSENRLKRLQKRHFRTMTEDIIIENQKAKHAIQLEETNCIANMEPARKRGALAGSSEPAPIGPDDLVNEMSIDVEFEGRGPEIRDYHCIKQLLQQLFLKAPVNLSDMTSVLIHQRNIGSVIKQVTDEDDEEQDEDDDDDDADQVFGITSVINITDKTSECVENLHKLMLDLSNQHSDSDTTLFVNRLLSDNDNQVGLLINERYVNIPPAISVPLFQALRKEMFKLKNKKQSYNFDYLIMICKLYKVKNDKKGNKSFENSEILWSNGEEELFDKLADYKFEFCVKNDKGPALSGTWVESDPEMIPFRRVLIFTMDKFCSITDQLESWLVNNDTADQNEG